MNECNRGKELLLGMKIEGEHTSNRRLKRKIALDHINEFPCYYSKGLIPLEKKLRRMKGGK
jgi:hypothetical protein